MKTGTRRGEGKGDTEGTESRYAWIFILSNYHIIVTPERDLSSHNRHQSLWRLWDYPEGGTEVGKKFTDLKKKGKSVEAKYIFLPHFSWTSYAFEVLEKVLERKSSFTCIISFSSILKNWRDVCSWKQAEQEGRSWGGSWMTIKEMGTTSDTSSHSSFPWNVFSFRWQLLLRTRIEKRTRTREGSGSLVSPVLFLVMLMIPLQVLFVFSEKQFSLSFPSIFLSKSKGRLSLTLQKWSGGEKE